MICLDRLRKAIKKTSVRIASVLAVIWTEDILQNHIDVHKKLHTIFILTENFNMHFLGLSNGRFWDCQWWEKLPPTFITLTVENIVALTVAWRSCACQDAGFQFVRECHHSLVFTVTYFMRKHFSIIIFFTNYSVKRQNESVNFVMKWKKTQILKKVSNEHVECS
jgi:hypothetical protein